MASIEHSKSLFSQKLDRIAFVSYFLGAVVPLLAVAVIVQQFVMPTLAETRLAIAIIAAVVCISILSLASFLILRRSTRESLGEMDRNNARLQSLLEASGALASVRDGSDAASTTALCAYGLTGGGIYIFGNNNATGALQLLESTGKDADKLLEKHGDRLRSLANVVMKENKPAICGPGKSSKDLAMAVVPIPADDGSQGALAVVHPEASNSEDTATVDSLTTLAALASVAFRNADLRDSQRNFFTHVTDIIVTALDAHLGYHTGHSHRVAQLSNRIGREMGLGDDRMQRLHFAALLHDIGMLKFDRNMQKNPRTCRKHAELGYRMLNRIRLWEDLAPFVHYHHERWDGQGYPEGLAGEAIPLEARIIGFCEAFDTFASSNSYKVALSWEDALSEAKACSGTHFDPKVIAAFLACAERGEIDPSAFGSAS